MPIRRDNDPAELPGIERLHPVDGFTLDNLMAVPDGAQFMLVDHIKRTVLCADWNEENREAMKEQFATQPGASVDHLFMAYLDPQPNSDMAAYSVVWENYGPEGDPEVWAACESFAGSGMTITPKLMLDLAIDMGHLDGDGILAMLRASARNGGAK